MFKKIVLTLLLAGTACNSLVYSDMILDPRKQNNQKKPTMIADRQTQKGNLTHQQEVALIKLEQDIRKERQAMIKANGGKPLTKEQRNQLNEEMYKAKQQIYMGKAAANRANAANRNEKAQANAGKPLTPEQRKWLAEEMIRTNRDFYSRKNRENNTGTSNEAAPPSASGTPQK